MRELIKAMLLCLFCLCLAQTARAQPTVRIDIVGTPFGFDAIFLKDFDLNRIGSAAPFFNIIINNNDSQDYQLSLELKIMVGDRDVVSGETAPFPFRSDRPARQLILSNQQLFTSAGPFRLRQTRVDRRFFEDILVIGRLPSEVYTFDVTLRDVTGEIDNSEAKLRITNPQKLDLIFPGSPVARRMRDCQQVFTNLPQFRWESDFRLFRVIVAEARQGEEPENALNQEPRYVRNYFVGRDNIPQQIPELPGRIEILPARAFQYPAVGSALALRPGKTYLWRVIGYAPSSSGFVPHRSEIFCFRVPRVDRFSAMQQQVEMLLRNMMGPELEKLFGEGGDLEGYDATRVTFNGKEVTVPELLIKMRKMDAKYSGYRIE